jgi:hypothetical protein
MSSAGLVVKSATLIDESPSGSLSLIKKKLRKDAASITQADYLKYQRNLLPELASNYNTNE